MTGTLGTRVSNRSFHPMTSKTNVTIPSLTSFRFITALVVFLFHCRIHLNWETGIDIFDRFINHGAVFMTGFFVLSGFIMAHVYAFTDFTKISNIRSFYLKRFAKIYPTYALTTIIYFAFFRDPSVSTHAHTPPETDSSRPALTPGVPCNPDIEVLSNLPVHRKQSRD